MIYETIVSTISEQGDVHVTPFGIRMQDGLVVISPYKPSTTLQNILTSGEAVLNLTDDVRVFAGALVGRQVWSLLPAEKVTGYRLAETLAHKELKLLKIEDDLVRPQLFLEVVHMAQHAPFQGFNRAQAAVIELAVFSMAIRKYSISCLIFSIGSLFNRLTNTANSITAACARLNP